MKFSELLFQLLTEDQEVIYQKYYSNIDRNVFLRIISADPKTVINNDKIDRIGPYGKFLIEMYKRKNLLFEDLPKATEYLTIVYKYNIKLDQNKIKTISDIFNYVKDFIVKSDKSLESIFTALEKNEYDLVFNGSKWMIYTPKTEKAAAYIGVDTEWCTTWGKYCLNPNYKNRNNHFKSHNNDGPLYIIINKQNKKDKYQLHFPSNQLKDSNDREITDRGEFFDDNLELKNFFFPVINDENVEKEILLKNFNIAKKFLSQDDINKIIERFKIIFGDNLLLNAIIDQNEELITSNIVDNNVLSLSVSDYYIEFNVKNLSRKIVDYYAFLSNLSSYSYSSSDYVYDDISNYENEEYLKPFLEEYYKKNKNLVNSFFLVTNFEDFYSLIGNDFITNEKIFDEFKGEYTDKTSSSLENAAKKELKHFEDMLKIEQYSNNNDIRVNIDKFKNYIISNNIFIIDNLNTLIDEYIYENNLPDNDYFDLPDYERIYPSYNDLENYIDEFFEKYYEEDLEDENNCLNQKIQLMKYINKYFDIEVERKYNFENKYVNIDINKPIKLDCKKGVLINLKNKKTDKEYNGFVKVENLPKYLTIKPLLERKKTT